MASRSTSGVCAGTAAWPSLRSQLLFPLEEGPAGAFPASTRSYGFDGPRLSAGGSPPGESTPDEEVMSWPPPPVPRFILLLGVLVVLHVAALSFNAPLEEIATRPARPTPRRRPGISSACRSSFTTARWVGGVLVPGLLVLGLLLVPYLDPKQRGVGSGSRPSGASPTWSSAPWRGRWCC